MYKKLIPYSICIALKSYATIDLAADKAKLCNTLIEIQICTKLTDKANKISANKLLKLDSILTSILEHASIISLGHDIYDETENKTKNINTIQKGETTDSQCNLKILLAQIEKYTDYDLNFYLSNNNPLIHTKKRSSIKRSLKNSLSKKTKTEKHDTHSNSNISVILNTIKKEYKSKNTRNTYKESNTRNSLINLPKDRNLDDELDKVLRDLAVESHINARVTSRS